MSACNIYDASGNLIWSLGDYGGSMCDIVQVPANTPLTLSYPDFAGRTATVTTVAGSGSGWGPAPTITYPSTIPTVAFASSSVVRTVYIWFS